MSVSGCLIRVGVHCTLPNDVMVHHRVTWLPQGLFFKLKSSTTDCLVFGIEGLARTEREVLRSHRFVRVDGLVFEWPMKWHWFFKHLSM